ncbi:carbohydrate ABC transporter permease [Diplocloster agilis]|uniref:Sugar ABC transporter permease n=1 Tax=Diplocloster agilis TaxID=2850323 RepID=A0A949NF16_9FIRM|nr:sugar ABC transporter permease [Diplocloster agilis]MBU9737104.1 sugar ABC transporter permease [Diplocloster agilis]MBU9746541.1 sugar ABC transporter permease [Diplocloster agilis]
MKSKRKEARYFYMFISPWLVGFFLLTFIPLIYSLYLSLTQYSGSAAPKFIGLRNYTDILFHDDLFIKSLINSFQYAIIAVPTSLTLALIIAFLLSKESKVSNFFQIVFYFPSIAAGAAVFTVAKFLLKGEGGLLNYILSFFGIQGPNWLTDSKWAMTALVLVNLIFCGSQMLIFLAGIKQIPVSYYEAAKIDGAGGMKCFFKITLPLISNVFVFNLVMGIINAFQIFVQPLIMTGGGPFKKTYMYGMYIYDSGFSFGRFGYAASLAWIMFLIILFISMFILKSLEKRMNYED